MSNFGEPIRPFYLTLPSPCPYLPGRVEQRVVAELKPEGDDLLFDQLSQAGFRRSQGWLYRPACAGCQECVSVRIPVKEFDWSRSWRRIWNKNNDLQAEKIDVTYDPEHYQLFSRYVKSRHGDGGMASMTVEDYRDMLDTAPSLTKLLLFRDREQQLVAACVIDQMKSGLSGVYKFFDPAQPKRSLGSFIVLWMIQNCKAIDLDYVYLGYWIRGCRKMNYKTRFKPMERLTMRGWQKFE